MSISNGLLYRMGLAISLSLLAMIVGCGQVEPKTEANTPPTEQPPAEHVAVLYYHGVSPFSQAVRDGATNAADEFDVAVEWMDAEPGDIDQQKQLLHSAISERVRGICICPLDTVAIPEALKQADAAGIPVVVFEKELEEGSKIVSCATSDHFHAGVTMAKFVSGQVNGDAQVLLVHCATDADSATRLRGFEYAATNDYTNLAVTQWDCAADPIAELEQLEVSDYDVLVTFNVADSQAVLKKLPTDQQLTYCGFGSWSGIEDAIRDGRLAATMLEDPYLIGFSAVMALSTHLAGEETGEYISAGEHIVTADNLDTENVQRLLESNRE